ncbi:hypothetical protein [uncultured Sphingomonas sp.]|uniref:hypothetical protein n=1 Tax=uncultured Sphingomonas sp. TaxID=158754 RepID=UPI0025D2C79E|nr:hypothetical protein [uncultured Sphingomonas sp.]
MASPNDPNANDAAPIVPPAPGQSKSMNPDTGKATDSEAAGADGRGTGGSAPRDGEK